MKLFEINEDNEVVINAPWVDLIPQFKALRTLVTKQDSRANLQKKNAKLKKLYAYIYFMFDFASPLKTWNEQDRHKESLKYTTLTELDIKGKELQDAIAHYKMLQIECCRPLKTYRAAMKGMEAMDEYFEAINFHEVDKQGKLLFTPNQFIDNVTKANKAYDELYKLEKRVEMELTQSTGIRGKSVMSDREVKYANLKGYKEEEWNETTGDIPEGPKLLDLGSLIKTEED
jgi:hypothetical protein